MSSKQENADRHSGRSEKTVESEGADECKLRPAAENVRDLCKGIVSAYAYLVSNAFLVSSGEVIPPSHWHGTKAKFWPP